MLSSEGSAFYAHLHVCALAFGQGNNCDFKKTRPPISCGRWSICPVDSTMARDGCYVLRVLLSTADRYTGCPIPVVLIVNQHSNKTETKLLNFAMKRPLHQMTVVKVMWLGSAGSERQNPLLFAPVRPPPKTKQKSFFLCIVQKDVLWKVLAQAAWRKRGLPVWGPHSWLWKYDVVSRCIWCCTSLSPSLSSSPVKCIQTALSYWELYYAAQGKHIASVAASRPNGSVNSAAALFSFHGPVTELGMHLAPPPRTTSMTPPPSPEDHQDWTARVLSSAATPWLIPLPHP